MNTAHEVLITLARRYAFAEVAALVAEGADGDRLGPADVAQVQQLCAFGQRLLDLDAEDFGETDTVRGANTEHDVADRMDSDAVPGDLRDRSLACRMPQASNEKHRGALASLRPAYRLLLEVIDIRFRRRETSAVVAAVHLASEYGPLLVWEQVLGHAADPARLSAQVGGQGSAWGDFEDRECPHTKAEKSAAKRVLTVSAENSLGWRSYLDRQHSNTSHALAVCAVECKRPCAVYNRLSPVEAALVTHGCRLARTLNDSAIIRLRHSAPVGHGFGVPSTDELLEAWHRSRESLARIDPQVAMDDGFALPGFAALVSAMAGQVMKPDDLVAAAASSVERALRA